MTRRIMIFRKRVRVVWKRSNLEVSGFLLEELSSSFVSVSGSSKIFEESPLISCAKTLLSVITTLLSSQSPCAEKTIDSRVLLSIIPGY